MLQNNDLDRGSVDIHNQEVVKISSLQNDEVLCELLECSPETDIVLCGVVDIHGYTYRPNVMLMCDWNELPSFAAIEYILLMRSQLYFIVQPWKTHYFDAHYQAYIVTNDTTQSFELQRHEDLCDHRPVHVVQSYARADNRWYIPIRFELC